MKKSKYVAGMMVYHSQLKFGIVQKVLEDKELEVSFIGYAPNVVVKEKVLELVDFADIANEYDIFVDRYLWKKKVLLYKSRVDKIDLLKAHCDSKDDCTKCKDELRDFCANDNWGYASDYVLDMLLRHI